MFLFTYNQSLMLVELKYQMYKSPLEKS